MHTQLACTVISARRDSDWEDNPWINAISGEIHDTGVVIVIAARCTDAKVYYVQEHTPQPEDTKNYRFDLIVLDCFNWDRGTQGGAYADRELMRYISFLVHLPEVAKLTETFRMRAAAEYVYVVVAMY